MKISFVTTVYNEEDTIDQLLISLSQQTRMPDEIVIIEAGSRDDTFQKLQMAKRKDKKIKVFVKKGNRAVGRNEGIKRASGNIIVVSDAGCILDKNWVRNISEPFRKKDIGVASGFYIAITKSVFEKCLATYTCVMEDKIDKHTFLPSSRSVAFRKEVWEKVGGYPEYLDTCEDLVFAKKCKQLGIAFTFVKEAIVYWPQRKHFLSAFRQFFLYAKGDGQALYFRPQTPLLILRFLVVFVLLVVGLKTKAVLIFFLLGGLLLLYLFWAIGKNFRYVKHWKAFFYLPLLQLLSDVAVFFGMVLGFVKRLYR